MMDPRLIGMGKTCFPTFLKDYFEEEVFGMGSTVTLLNFRMENGEHVEKISCAKSKIN